MGKCELVDAKTVVGIQLELNDNFLKDTQEYSQAAFRRKMEIQHEPFFLKQFNKKKIL